MLYHEAFHAYSANFVYPTMQGDLSPHSSMRAGELPRWLNEGLAQIFEGAIVEAGELRVDYPDRDRLDQALSALLRNELLPVRELLHLDHKHFFVRHSDEKASSHRAYLTSWVVASYLMFDRRLIGTTDLDLFVKSCMQADQIDAAFQKLVHQPLAEFEKGMQAWLRTLAPGKSLINQPTP